MAAKKRAKTTAKRKRRLGPFDYRVSVMSGRVVIEGLNDGNIYGEPGQWVSFAAGTGVASFTFQATDLKKNDSKRRLTKKWPFKGPEPTWPQAGFCGELKSPGLLKKIALFKYSILVTGATTADPMIIIQK